ncbi:MFS transporter [Glycomyces tarimensis]
MGFHGTATAVEASGRTFVRRPAMRALRAAAVVGGFAQSLTGAAATLLAYEVAGSEAAAGLPQTALVAGAAVAAAVSSRLAVPFGRRRTLAAGAAAATSGSLIVTWGAVASSLSLMLAGCVLLGAGTATVMLGRYAAAELAPEATRPRAMASVLLATTVGAIAGPNLLDPSSRAADAIGLPPLTGPFVFGAAAFALTALVLAAGLRDDARPAPVEQVARTGAGTLASAVPGLAVLTLSNLVMVSVMTLAPLQLGHHGRGLVAIGLVIGVHIAGMFAPSPLSAALVTRVGAARTAMLGGCVTAGACALAAIGAGNAGTLAVAMAMLGVGWNLGLISGSALLTAATPRQVRLRREGLGEVGMGVAAAAGGLACGPLMAQGGYASLALAGAAVAALVPVLARTVDR